MRWWSEWITLKSVFHIPQTRQVAVCRKFSVGKLKMFCQVCNCPSPKETHSHKPHTYLAAWPSHPLTACRLNCQCHFTHSWTAPVYEISCSSISFCWPQTLFSCSFMDWCFFSCTCPLTFSFCHYELIYIQLTCNCSWFIDIVWPLKEFIIKVFNIFYLGLVEPIFLYNVRILNSIFYSMVFLLNFIPIYGRCTLLRNPAFDNTVMMQTRLYGWW